MLERYAAEIAEGVDRSEVLLLILSEAANQSPHVLREVERAVTKSIPILVYKIEEVTLTKSMEYFLMTHQWMNAKKNNYDDILENIEKLKTALEQSGNVALQKMVQSSDKTVLKKPRNKNKFLVALAAVVVILLLVAGVVMVTIGKGVGSGKYNYDGDVSYYGAETEAETDIELQAFVRGDSSWENSVIRTWLNSADENVEYIGQAPCFVRD